MANSQDAFPQPPDLLAAVVLHTLVAEGREGMTLTSVAGACERDPGKPDELREVEAAIEILLDDGLAQRETSHGDEQGGKHELFRPTRAAIRANELSF